MAIKAINPRVPKFSIETQDFGKVNFSRITGGGLDKLEKANIDNSRVFLNYLISTLGIKEDNTYLKLEEASKLTSDEREQFIKGCLDAHPDWLEKLEQNNIKGDGETNEDYLYRVYQAYYEGFKQSMFKMVNPFKNIFGTQEIVSSKFQRLSRESKTASDLLGESIKTIKAEQLQPHTHSFEFLGKHLETATDIRLGHVVDRLGSIEGLAVRMADTVKSVSDAASQFLLDFEKASNKVNDSSKGAFRLALWAIGISILFPLVQIGISEYKDRGEQVESNQARDMLIKRLDELIVLEKERNATINLQNNENNNTLLDASKNLKDVVKDLSNIKSAADKNLKNTKSD